MSLMHLKYLLMAMSTGIDEVNVWLFKLGGMNSVVPAGKKVWKNT